MGEHKINRKFFLNLRGICLFCEALQFIFFLRLFIFCEWHLYKANEFHNNLPSRNFTGSTVCACTDPYARAPMGELATARAHVLSVGAIVGKSFFF